MKDSIMASLPETEKTFTINVQGEITKQLYMGEFTCKILNKKERAFVSKHYAFLNGDMGDFLDPATKEFHQIIAYLRFAIVKFPSFWGTSDLGYALMDESPIIEVYKQVLNFENEWVDKIWGTSKAEKEESKEDGK